VIVYRPCGCADVLDGLAYTYPHVGDAAIPNRGSYAVPGLAHVTVPPSPKVHTIRDARAVIVTVTPPSDSLARCGPHVPSVTAVDNHTGNPTAPAPPGCGATTICAPSRCSFANARRANTAGSTVGVGFLRHTISCMTAPLPGAV
jgi:hypothetical protein